MRRAQTFLHHKFHNPVGTASLVVFDCLLKQKAAGCADVQTLLAIFSSDYTRALSGAGSYCGIEFGTGMQNSPLSSPSTPGIVPASDDIQPMSAPTLPGATTLPEEDRRLLEWRNQHMPNCFPIQFNLSDCQKQAKSAKKQLISLGVNYFGKTGVEYDGKTCPLGIMGDIEICNKANSVLLSEDEIWNQTHNPDEQDAPNPIPTEEMGFGGSGTKNKEL
jgi:hypothetical protein